MDSVNIQQALINLTEQEDGSVAVSGRELHEFLEIKTQYTKWFDRMIEYGFVENEDYGAIAKKRVTAQGNTTTYVDHILTLEMAKAICVLNNRNKKSTTAYKFFCSVHGEKVFFLKQQRNEVSFGELLDGVTGIEWIKQYPIDGGKYRLDFYLPSVLIVEYDESHHKYQTEMDFERINYCREWINEYGDLEGFDEKWRIPVIRVREGEELEGLNRIIKHLVGFGEITDKDYNLEPCDIGNKSTTKTPKVTGKGQQYFINKFLTIKGES